MATDLNRNANIAARIGIALCTLSFVFSAFATQIAPRSVAGSPAPGNTCTSAQLSQKVNSVECRAFGERSATYWVAVARTPNPDVRSESVGEPLPRDLGERLRRGGLTIFFRHMHTDWNQTSVENPQQEKLLYDTSLVENCSEQRNLVDRGRESAVAIGNQIRRLDLRISEVLASPFCRTRETAGLLNVGDVRYEYGLFDTFKLGVSPATDRINAFMRQTLSRTPKTGTIRVLVSHAINLSAVAGVMPGEGEAVVYEPDGRGAWKLVARITPSQWATIR
jgi:phosphohistidine phosphatase SixA